MSTVLTIEVEPSAISGASFTFSAPELCTVGRKNSCQIRFPDTSTYNEISRQHCIFQINPPIVFVVDLDSKNGTFVNGRRIEKKTLLQDNDTVRIGPAFLRILLCDLNEREEAGELLVNATPEKS